MDRNDMNGSREALLEQFGEALWSAEVSGRPIAPLTEHLPDLTLEEAYRVQRLNRERRFARGERLVGHKIGLTSKAMQEQLGVDQPDVGAITDRMVIADQSVLDSSGLIAARVEAEFAFRLASDLREPITYESVRAAIGTVMLAAEIIDSRIRDWNIKLADTVADNASAAAVVFGPEVLATPALLDALPEMDLELVSNNEVNAVGSGAAILGDPLQAVLWLARELATLGQPLQAGDLILAGAVHASIPLLAGMKIEVRQSSLPALSFSTT